MLGCWDGEPEAAPSATSRGVGGGGGRVSSRVWLHRKVTRPERTQDKFASSTGRQVWAQLKYKSYVHISHGSVKTAQDKIAITNLTACVLLLAMP